MKDSHPEHNRSRQKLEYEAKPDKRDLLRYGFIGLASLLTVVGVCYAAASYNSPPNWEEFENKKKALSLLPLDDQVEIATGGSVPFNVERNGQIIRQRISGLDNKIVLKCLNDDIIPVRHIVENRGYYRGRLEKGQCWLEPT